MIPKEAGLSGVEHQKEKKEEAIVWSDTEGSWFIRRRTSKEKKEEAIVWNVYCNKLVSGV